MLMRMLKHALLPLIWTGGQVAGLAVPDLDKSRVLASFRQTLAQAASTGSTPKVSAVPRRVVEELVDPAPRAAPGPSLDQLFKKTRTAPAVYWKPLSDEEVERRKQPRANKNEPRTEREADDRRRERR